ncbi:hypothetical protein BDQ17DRAFT_1419255 [Cyathus striatus]|nr:hypothetical protein BDQ17DRAFT_1419255 [Cyathus striatus]
MANRRTPELVIIDGLDECSDRKVQVTIIQVLTWVSSQPLVHLRFLIASRPELEIRNAFNSRSVQKICTRLVLDNRYAPDNDIHVYLRNEFTRIKEEHTLSLALWEDATRWPSDRDIWKLVKKSSGQFIYAATVIKYIADYRRDPREQLRTIIDIQPGGTCRESPYAELDAVYIHILKTAAMSQDYDSTSHIFMVLLYTRRHLEMEMVPVPRLAEFLGVMQSTITLLLVDLHSAMHIPNSNLAQDAQIIRFFHASFVDFLQDSARSGKFFIAKEKAHATLGRDCFTTIVGTDPSQRLYLGDLSYVQRNSELSNAQVLVRKIILKLETEDIGDILFRMFKFNFGAMERSHIVLPAAKKLEDICGYISRAVDEAALTDICGLETHKAIISFAMAKLFPEKFYKRDIYYCWQATMLDSFSRAKNLILDDKKCQHMIRSMWEISFAERFSSGNSVYMAGDVLDFMVFEYLLERTKPSTEFGVFLRTKLLTLVSQWRHECQITMPTHRSLETFLSREEQIRVMVSLEHAVNKYLRACNYLQPHQWFVHRDEQEVIHSIFGFSAALEAANSNRSSLQTAVTRDRQDSLSPSAELGRMNTTDAKKGKEYAQPTNINDALPLPQQSGENVKAEEPEGKL